MPGSCPEPSRRVHRAFSSPSSHSSAAPSPSQLSVYPLAGFHHRGRQQRGNRQSRSKCPARPYPARWGIDMRESVQCLAASAELLPCCTVISDPWDPLGVPRTLAEPRVRCEAVTVAIRAPRSLCGTCPRATAPSAPRGSWKCPRAHAGAQLSPVWDRPGDSLLTLGQKW